MSNNKSNDSLQSFVKTKFRDLEEKKFLKFQAIANYIDSLGASGWSQSAEDLYNGHSMSDAFMDISLEEFSLFLSNSFIYKWLDAKVIEFQRPVLRQIIMSLKDSKLNAQEMRGLEFFKSLVDKNDLASDGIIYVYVQTNIKNGDKDYTENLMKTYTEVDK